MSIRARWGFHDGVGRIEAAVTILALALMLPGLAVITLVDRWKGDRP